MADEYKRIMDFFNLSPEDREKHVQDIFEDSVAFFEHFKHVIETGTPEQKKEAIEKVTTMKNRIAAETQKVCEKTGMSEEELSKYARSPENFTSEQWETMEKSKEELDKEVADLKKKVGGPSSGTADGKDDAAKGSKKRRRKPKNWLPS